MNNGHPVGTLARQGQGIMLGHCVLKRLPQVDRFLQVTASKIASGMKVLTSCSRPFNTPGHPSSADGMLAAGGGCADAIRV